jgi:branched-chain amino acid transport system ATP-binding protein
VVVAKKTLVRQVVFKEQNICESERFFDYHYTTSMDQYLVINNLEVVFNDVILVIKGISLEVSEGAVVALLGANGAGKTTTLKAVSGLLDYENGDITDGSIEFMGKPISSTAPEEIVRMGISHVPEGRRIFTDLSVSENILAGAHTRRDMTAIRSDHQKVVDYFPILGKRGSQRALFLSGGEQQMLSIARALMSKPKIMMLDEPSLGLAPLVVKEIFAILKEINRDENTALLLVEQNAKLALELAHYGYIMENGKIVLDNKSDKLKENEDVKEFYLGITEESKRKRYSEVKHYKRRKRWLS